jgi:hypothetical protein
VIVKKERMPFKDQVKAWAKIHRGTVSIHCRIPVDLSRVDRLSRFSGITSRKSSVRKFWLERYPHNNNDNPVVNKHSIYPA